MHIRSTVIVLLICLHGISLRGQLFGDMPFLQPADSLHTGRFWTCAAAGAAIYTGVSIALWHSWYRDYELGPFHFFNDWKEWEHMDKWGHVFTAYNEANWSFKGALWTGMPRRKAMWTGVGIGMLLQTTVEVMDGFSEKWGFSGYDFGFNVLGVSLFAAQEMAWQDQRIVMKVSNSLPEYPDELALSTDGLYGTSIRLRAEELFGKPPYQRFLKDYNGQTIWLSGNIRSFLGTESRFPKWLNLAFGYGAENMYAGYGYEWEIDGVTFTADPIRYPRYRQFYLSPDIDFTRIPTRHRGLKTLFGILNFIKIPAPALEVNTLGRVKLHAFYW
ncbi:MAG: DUF2279 domain-containing protein [Saprospirales bacterium]|nr:DUF2279 domain-containing protein [Saprospirales bacterium]